MNYKTEEILLLEILLWVNAHISRETAPLATYTTHVEPGLDLSKATLWLKQREMEKPV